MPGYYRATKQWDVLVIVDGELLAAVELKSHIGPSFGNNYNNRIEEALGSAVDIMEAHNEGLLAGLAKPWLGWLMLLEDSEKSQTPVDIRESHFLAHTGFKEASYANRYELFCRHLIEKNLYDSACLILSDRRGGLVGQYSEPCPEIGFAAFASSLQAGLRQRIDGNS